MWATSWKSWGCSRCALRSTLEGRLGCFDRGVTESIPIQDSLQCGFDQLMLHGRSCHHLDQRCAVKRPRHVRLEHCRTTQAELHIHCLQANASAYRLGRTQNPMPARVMKKTGREHLFETCGIPSAGRCLVSV